MSLRSPLGRVRGLGSAKDGTAHWWMQRLSAIALIPLTLWFVVSVVVAAGASHETIAWWIGNPLVATLLILLVAALFYHAQLGLQVVIEDYVSTEWKKMASVIVVKFAAIALTVLSIVSILKISFGA